MKFCTNCGKNIGDNNFCGNCGTKNLKYKSPTTYTEEVKVISETRDIEKYIRHLKTLVDSRSSLIVDDDLKVYRKVLLSLSEEKFRKIDFIKFINFKRVNDINSYLEIESTFTEKQIRRHYKDGKIPNKFTTNTPKSKFSILFLLLLFVVSLLFVFSEKGDSEKYELNIQQENYEYPEGVSPSCFCMDSLTGGKMYKSTPLQKTRCRRMYICWENAQYDCLLNTENVWTEC